MNNFKLILAYDGTPYTGWQKTNTGTSIEELLTQALQTILQHPVHLQAASRTDAGVHAQGQVVNFFSNHPIPLSKLRHSLNQLLPKEIVVKEITLADPSFHPTLDALKKEYRYALCNGRVQLPFHRMTSWHVPLPLNLSRMQQAAHFLLGRHDFSTFCNERALWDRNPICHLESIRILPLESDRVHLFLLGDHFLYKMARNLVGTLVYVGLGKIPAKDMPALLLSKDRTRAGPSAPAHGLRLEKVFYN